MNLPKTILVATDFGEPAEKAIAYAVELGAKLGGRVHLLHTWMLPAIAMPEGMVLPLGQMADDIEAAAKASMDKLLTQYRRPGLDLTGSVVTDDPRDAIVKMAGELKADLVVIGTHGRKGLRRVLLGSVAESVVRLAPCPVLVVR